MSRWMGREVGQVKAIPRNHLYYGDNLEVLRDYIKDESVDLIYLDPPFNSKRAYNVLFKETDGAAPDAQVRAFEDYWRWDAKAEQAFQELTQPRTRGRGAPERLIVMIEALRKFLGDGNMIAYIVMMAARLLEMHRVLKPTGSLYLHCDPTASHYLKLVLDAVFGPENFLNEVIWKRTTAHSSAKKWAPIHDVLLYYSKGNRVMWNSPRLDYEQAYLNKYYRFDDGDGRLYWRADLCAAGVRHGGSGKSWRGLDVTAKGMHWKFAVETLDKLDKDGRIYWPKGGTGWPQYKRYREELKGRSVSDLWDDIDRINPVGAERLGYPTQKPVAILERIISASSNPGDVVLDPFCGCGTAIEAAQKLGRAWIGIDITYLAIPIIRKRLAAFPNATYKLHGVPADLESARVLAESDPYQFQWWALDMIGAFPTDAITPMSKEGKKGGDKGIDGVIRFREQHQDATTSHRIIVSVKAGHNLNPAMVRELRGTMEREKSPISVLVTMHEPSAQMRTEAANAGVYHPAGSKNSYQRLQIITAVDIFQKKRVQFPGYDVTGDVSEDPASSQLSMFDPETRRRAPRRATPLGVNIRSAPPATVAGKARRGAR